jgi:tetratricopeptide (TPR) repeat protein
MSEELIFDLLAEWEGRRRRGREVSPEKLCQAYPEVLEVVRKRILQLKATEWMAGQPARPGSPVGRSPFRPLSQKSRAAQYFRQGWASANVGDYQKAIASYSEAMRLLPQGYAFAHYDRGLAYLCIQDTRRAIADFTEAIRIDPNHVWAHLQRAGAYRIQKQYALAIADCTEAIRLDPDQALACRLLGRALRKQGLSKQAATEYTEALRFRSKQDIKGPARRLQTAGRAAQTQSPEVERRTSPAIAPHSGGSWGCPPHEGAFPVAVPEQHLETVRRWIGDVRLLAGSGGLSEEGHSWLQQLAPDGIAACNQGGGRTALQALASSGKVEDAGQAQNLWYSLPGTWAFPADEAAAASAFYLWLKSLWRTVLSPNGERRRLDW